MAGGGNRNEFRVEAVDAAVTERRYRGLAAEAPLPRGWRSEYARRARAVIADAVKRLQGDVQRIDKLLAFLDRNEVAVARHVVLHNVWQAEEFAKWAFVRVANEAPAAAPVAAPVAVPVAVPA